MNKTEQFRYDILEKLRQNFDTLGEAAILRDPAEGMNTYVLNVLHTEIGNLGDEVMGEYYFMPTEEESRFHLFYSVLTLTEEMPSDRYGILGSAANALNFYLPAGSLVFSEPDKIMAYKFISLIPVEASAEEALNIIDGNVGISLQLVDQYLDQLMKLMHGEIELEDFYAILPQAYRS